MERLYLDICAFKRPFDDQRQERIRRETEAVAVVVEMAERGEVALVRSPAHDLENARNPREDRRLAVDEWLKLARVKIGVTSVVEARARLLEKAGLSPLDSLHVAFAEAADSGWFVTCDDRLVRRLDRVRPSLRILVGTPLDFFTGRGK